MYVNAYHMTHHLDVVSKNFRDQNSAVFWTRSKLSPEENHITRAVEVCSFVEGKILRCFGQLFAVFWASGKISRADLKFCLLLTYINKAQSNNLYTICDTMQHFVSNIKIMLNKK